MDDIRIIKVKQSVFANNNSRAEEVRKKLKEKNVYLVNLMSSPGSGKTTFLVNLINRLKKDLRIGVMEADIDATVDAETISTRLASEVCKFTPLVNAILMPKWWMIL